MNLFDIAKIHALVPESVEQDSDLSTTQRPLYIIGTETRYANLYDGCLIMEGDAGKL